MKKIGQLLVAFCLVLASCNTTTYPNGRTAVELLAVVNGTGIDVALENLKQWVSTNPGQSESQIEIKFRDLLIQTAANPIYAAVSSTITLQVDYANNIPVKTPQLNNQEKTICNESAYYCALILVAGRNAYDWLGQFFPWQLYRVDNEADAFRHTSWNAFMRVYIGLDRAKRFADAHEYGSTTQIQGSIGQQMDFFNNDIGRIIGNDLLNSATGAGNFFVANKVKADLKTGRMRVVSRAFPTEVQATGNTLVVSNAYASTWSSGF
jgi:hypothetical protein